MQTKSFLMFVAVAILVGTIVSMTTPSGIAAAQTIYSSNSNSSNSNSSNSNTSTNNCPENDSAGGDENSTTAATSDSENSGATESTSASDNATGATDQFPLPKFDPCNFSNDGIVNNTYYTLTPGTTFTYEGETEDGHEKNIVIVTNQTREILGVNATVVWDRVWLEDELIEETFDWFAQDKEGNVWYLGEDSKEYENGEVTTTEGSWEAGVDGAKPGINMEADPQIGDRYKQEFYKGHAEDQAEVVSLNETVTVPFSTFTNCLKTSDSTPLEPTTGDEDKYYCTDVGGVVLEIAIESGERSELIDFNQTDATADDADEPGDNDVNDEEDIDMGNGDAGEASDQE